MDTILDIEFNCSFESTSKEKNNSPELLNSESKFADWAKVIKGIKKNRTISLMGINLENSRTKHMPQELKTVINKKRE
tara:strand:+ start:280 stop:513 length:234 start_codon:yes stop_codon:yes gene_type:complete